MPYIHPRRALQNTDILDYEEMNSDIVPAAEKYGGRLNAHDFRSSILLAAAPTAFYIPRNAFRIVDPGWALSTTPTVAGSGPDAVFKIENTTEWQVVEGMTLTFTTGQSKLAIFGQLQMIAQEWSTGAYNTPPPWAGYSGAPLFSGENVQFAIRVDGNVILESRTGSPYDDQMRFDAIRPVVQVQSTSVGTPGMATPTPEEGHSIGPLVIPVRVGVYADVGAGAHTVEIVARRTMRVIGLLPYYATNDYVQVYNRFLTVLESPIQPISVTSSSVVNVDRFEPEDTLSAAAIGTNRVDAIRTAYNNVLEGAVARGAFNHEHLPNVLRDANIATLTTANAGQTTNAEYPGFTSNVIAGARVGVTGWWEIEDGGLASQLRVAPSGGGNWLTNGTSSWFILLGNVRCREVNDAGSSIDPRKLAVFTLGYRRADTGAIEIIDETEMGVVAYNPVNQDTGAPTAFAKWPIDVDIPLFFAWNLTASGVGPLAFDISYFSVYVSATSMTPASAVNSTTVTWGQGSLIALWLRG